MYYGNVGGIGSGPQPQRPQKLHEPSPTQIQRTGAVRSGKVSSDEAFNNYYVKDSNGRISQESFRRFWNSAGYAVTKDAAKAIYANYDKDGNGLDAQEYAKYQQEYSKSLRGINYNSDSLFDIARAEQWEAQYNHSVNNGKVDYTTFSNYKKQDKEKYDIKGIGFNSVKADNAQNKDRTENTSSKDKEKSIFFDR